MPRVLVLGSVSYNLMLYTVSPHISNGFLIMRLFSSNVALLYSR
jgi:hypothetical protein